MTEDNVEKLALRIVSVVRRKDSIAEDLKQGYVYFSVEMEVDGRPMVMTKKIRLDKPDKMFQKFMAKIPKLCEERYKEVKYYVADKTPPTAVEADIINKDVVEEKMYILLEEVEQFIKTGKFEVLATDKIEF